MEKLNFETFKYGKQINESVIDTENSYGVPEQSLCPMDNLSEQPQQQLYTFRVKLLIPRPESQKHLRYLKISHQTSQLNNGMMC